MQDFWGKVWPIPRPRHIDAAKKLDVTNISTREVAASRKMSTTKKFRSCKTTAATAPILNFDLVPVRLFKGTDRFLKQ